MWVHGPVAAAAIAAAVVQRSRQTPKPAKLRVHGGRRAACKPAKHLAKSAGSPSLSLEVRATSLMGESM